MRIRTNSYPQSSGQIPATEVWRDQFLECGGSIDIDAASYFNSINYNVPVVAVSVASLAVHKHLSIKQWVAKNKLVELHHTPTYSSWLNQAEIWFNILSKDVLKEAVWHSRQQLIDRLMEYIRTYNKERAKPFSWTYNPYWFTQDTED